MFLLIVEVTYIDYDGDVKEISNKSTEDVIVTSTVIEKLEEIRSTPATHFSEYSAENRGFLS